MINGQLKNEILEKICSVLLITFIQYFFFASLIPKNGEGFVQNLLTLQLSISPYALDFILCLNTE